MGLQHDPITGQIETDLDEAKVSIDVAAQLSEHLEPKLEEEDRRRIHTLIRDLRLNFVEKSKEPK
jgi:ribosome maturation factor RimP